MAKRLLGALCICLTLLLCAASLAEGGIKASPLEAPIDETDLQIGAPPAAEGEDGVDVALNYVADEEATPEPTAVPPEEDPGETPEEGPDYFGEALKVSKIRLTRDISKKVVLGLSYRVVVNSDDAIKGSRSSKKSVATLSRDGTLNLYSAGSAKITVATVSGAKYVLSLTVKDAPAPTDVKLGNNSNAVWLTWQGSKFATGYLVQISYDDGASWTDFKAVSGDAAKCYVTKAVTGTALLRVLAILGDHFGGTSDAVAVLTKVEDVKVICKEDYLTGPYNSMNVIWSASPAASKYAIYRATLPSEEYELLGTTTNRWFPDRRDPLKLYAYRVRPLRGNVEEDATPLSDAVNLWTGYDSNVLPPSDLTSKTGIILLVNKQAQVVTAYIRDANGRYTIPLRHMICSTGRVYERTRNGTYTLQSKRGEWYTYPGPSGDTIRWPSVYRSGYYFHSPLYNRNHSIRGYTVARLGSRASAGCIRLKVRDAEWVWRRCDIGTTVYICDGKALKNLNKALLPKDVTVKGF